MDLGYVKGRRIRRCFQSKGEAETWAEEKRVDQENEGAKALALSPGQRAEAADCIQRLRPYNAALRDATSYYIEHYLKYRNAPTVSEIVAKLLADSTAAGRRPKTLEDLRVRLGHFAKTFGQRRLSEVTLPELQSWINYPDWSPRSRIHYATKISQLFNYAVKHGWADVNLAGRVARPGAEDSEPGILTVKQSNALLQCAPEFGLLPYVALGLFAGLRAAETRRLDWSAVKLSERTIIIGSEVAKKRMRRAVDINDTLASWIVPYIREQGPVVEAVAFRDGFDAMRAKAGLKQWPVNALRHSFGSYHLAIYGDAVRTAAQMGNDSNVVHRFYKALVTKAEAQHFWALRPEGAAGKVMPMPPDGEQSATVATSPDKAAEKARQAAHS
ncbi:MAG: tyrosine-type recombinase/integrase [Verrucomicrobia bacterium]|nr:tyrosine-type recombinase/integrase [Verrucomicrobiota bacterium]